jgi:MoxR-like ATPase
VTSLDSINELKSRMSRSIIGQQMVVERLILALLANGNVLMEGLPGLAKTRAIKSMAKNLESDFSRIQFTPDLLPSDVTGTEIYYDEGGKGRFVFQKGPIFGNLILADEINRAPAKVQAALLEAMEERQVTVAGKTYKLPELFMVLATQNPVEQEGTYPLPEAQLDRFLLKIRVGYPSEQEEDRILQSTFAAVGSVDIVEAGIRPVGSREMVHRARAAGALVRIEDPVRKYIRDLVRASRATPMIMLGAGPRAGVHLMVAARWSAALEGRMFVTPDDVVRVLHPVICHRLILAPEVELDGLGAEEVIDRVAATVEVPR